MDPGSSPGRSMSNHLESPAVWARNEFGFAKLKDRRRNERLVNIATRLAANPGGTLPQAFADWAELKGAYRFFDSPVVGYEEVVQPHLERTRRTCREPGEYLLLEDTSGLDFSGHRHTKGLGVIGDGNGRGFEVHSTLAVRVEGWTVEQRPEGRVVGLFAQQCRRPRPAPEGERRGERLQRRRKSSWWAEVFEQVGGPASQCRWIYIGDRESDCYEPIHTCQQLGIDFIIRGSQDRRLADEAGRLHEALVGAPVLGQSTVELRSRAGEPARTAIVELRAARVDLDGPWRPGGQQEPLRGVWVLEVKEVHAPEEIKEPLYWILLTSLPCTTLNQARQIVGRYTGRWWVEEYHKALKSGARVEDSQLERAGRLEPLIAVLAVVAVRLLSTKMLARSRPESFEAASSFGPEMLSLLEKKVGKPKGGWTNRNLIRSVAHVGGFIGRKGDGEPGWQTIWRGWQRLMWMCEGVNLIQE